MKSGNGVPVPTRTTTGIESVLRLAQDLLWPAFHSSPCFACYAQINRACIALHCQMAPDAYMPDLAPPRLHCLTAPRPYFKRVAAPRHVQPDIAWPCLTCVVAPFPAPPSQTLPDHACFAAPGQGKRCLATPFPRRIGIQCRSRPVLAVSQPASPALPRILPRNHKSVASVSKLAAPTELSLRCKTRSRPARPFIGLPASCLLPTPQHAKRYCACSSTPRHTTSVLTPLRLDWPTCAAPALPRHTAPRQINPPRP
jgi:hypothetical protein